ncbi:MAG: bifunctional DNA primase/polymerase, partial [Pelagibacterales bacterium]|nr:bifunctional DNA primase/polymerase [Pelagibacterales bacterium]
MITPAEYLNKKLPVIPCNGKIPIAKAWQDNDFTIADFKPGDNIGLKMSEHIDIDIDNPICKKFLPLYMEQPSAVFGRKSNPQSHHLYKGKANFKKFSLTKHFESYYESFPHKACLIEIRSGKDKQSIVPGSKIEGEDVEWNLLEGIAPYSRDANKDISKVAFSAAVLIMFPDSGARDDYLFTIACLLCRVKWTEDEINKFCLNIIKAKDLDNLFGKRNYGTIAQKALKKKGRLFGFTKLKEITGVAFPGLMNLFTWVGLEPPNEKLLELIDGWYYLEDTGLMYNPSTGKEIQEQIFNNNYLYDFPGGRNKDKAFKLLLKEPEFQTKKLLSKQFLPDYPYPIAEVG